MDYLCEVLENVSAGEVLKLIVALSAVGTALIVSCKKFTAWYEKVVLNKVELNKSKETSTKLEERVENLTKSIEELKVSVDRVQQDMNEYKTNTQKELKSFESTLETFNEEKETEHSQLSKSIDILIESDRNTIRSYITNEWYKWSTLGYIPTYAMRNLEDQFTSYEKEKGNHFAFDLMQNLRALPNKNPNGESLGS